MRYEKIKYPDGQISAKILSHTGPIIYERINSYEDLAYVAAIREATRFPPYHLHLKIPCLFGQRSDRRFAVNQSFDLKIIAQFINNLSFAHVEIFDPHSDVALALINNSFKKSSFEYVQQAVEDINKNNTNRYGTNLEKLVLVSPDAGAYKKVFEYGEKLGLEVVAANKHRASDGTIDLRFMGDVKGKECLIVDDLCDGGFTFYKLAKALRAEGATKVYLYVSHGYFSKGFITPLEKSDPDSSLSKCLDKIYCTNSVKDVDNTEYDSYRTYNLHGLIHQFKII